MKAATEVSIRQMLTRYLASRWLTAAALAIFQGALLAQSTLNYYFAHIAAAGVWRTTFTYINGSTQPVICTTNFYSDSGTPLALEFGGNSTSSVSDTIPAGGMARHQTDAQPGLPVVTGWASASCTGPVKASALFRSYNGAAATGEASVIAMTAPASQFVTYADQSTGVAYANPSSKTAMLTFTAKDASGNVLGSQNLALPAGGHGSQNVGPLLGISSFQGSVTITSSTPVVSLTLNFEAAPVFSTLPAGQTDGRVIGPANYYFAHIAAASVWRTTFTLINASAQNVTCTTNFYSDSGAPLALQFNGNAITSTTDVIPAGGLARRQTDAQPVEPVVTGWAMARCTGPVKASALFRSYNGSTPTGEASVIATSSPASQFVTYADQSTGVAYVNPGQSPATITFTALDLNGATLASTSLTLTPGAHGAANLGPLFGLATFQGSVTITALQPILSLSLNFEAAPSFSSLPAGDGGSFQIYGVWHCGNDGCNWSSVRNMTQFDSVNHWIIDRGDGSGLPSVNLVVLSFLQPTKLLNLTNDAQTVNGIPIGINSALVSYFTSHNVQVMLSIGGSSYVSDWDQALTANATQLGLNAANAATALGVGMEIDYENNASPNLSALQDFINAYRSVLPYDPTGANPAARLTIDLAAGDEYLVALCSKATSDWLNASAPLLDFANATVPNGQPAPSDAEFNWQQHVDGLTTLSPVVPPLAPARLTGAVRLEVGSTPEPECNNFIASLENNTGIFVQTISPSGAGQTAGMLGYMFWDAEVAGPTSCQNGVGAGARNYMIPIPIPPLRQQ